MVAVDLRIVEPENDAAFTDSQAVTFRGAHPNPPPELADVPLFFRWYSSLNPDAKEGQYSMNVDALSDPSTPFPETPVPLGMGSHVITFAASDRAGEADADFEAARHAGVTGGLDGDAPCVIHVFKASIVAPAGGNVDREELTVEAEAPPIWATPVNNNGDPSFELNEEYQKYNRLRFRWRFEPVGAPAGRPTREFIPAPADFGFEVELGPVRITYQPALPATATGRYRIVLFVEDSLDQGLGRQRHEVEVTLTG